MLLLVTSIVLTLSVAEIVVRVSGTPDVASSEAGAPPSAVDDAKRPVSRYAVHPYSGWASVPGRVSLAAFRSRWADAFPNGQPTDWSLAQRHVNRLGFESSIDDYRLLENDDFVVGVFGGSVAEHLGILGGDALRAAILRERPELEGRIRILNCASGGFKQPQQVAILTQMLLLGVPFDVVVNLDGLNEVLLGAADARRGSHPSLPSRRHYRRVLDLASGTLSREELLLSATVVDLQQRAEGWRRTLEAERWWTRSRLVGELIGRRVRYLEREALTVERELQDIPVGVRSSSFELEDPCLREGDRSCLELIGSIWFEGSLAMRALASSKRIEYLHFLQPNQYHRTRRSPSDDELRLAFEEGSRADRAVRSGYPGLLAHGRRLSSEGVLFFDFTEIFDRHPETLYRDRCCHLNWRGNQILGQEIGAEIATRFDGAR